VPQIEEKTVALLLTIVADVDAGVVLPAHRILHRGAADAAQLGHIDGLPAGTPRQQVRQFRRPRKAAGMGGQNPVLAYLHGLPRWLVTVDSPAAAVHTAAPWPSA
jgi:hypothetical protein